MTNAQDLTQEAPRSPRTRIGGYALMARMIDKGRATLAGTAGDYHFDCPLDNRLFGFKGVQADEVRKLLATDASDEQIIAWFNTHGTPKTADEIKTWSDQCEAWKPYNDPEKKDWFVGECAKVGLKPESSTLFDFLEADDAVSLEDQPSACAL